ncbi:MAG: fasciclin domain-containing protein [Bacteroidaceae bacterium]|nr:fasciclin domain-containing protein [Bacteroidaceae bacterium]
MKTNRKVYILLVTAVLVVMGCSEVIDESARYVFKEETLISYMEKHAETYSEYLDVLKNTPVSEVSSSTLYQLLTARGNYTVFAPTNKAMHKYLCELCEQQIISDSTWEGFNDSIILDSIRKVIAYSSIIDGGDYQSYETYSFPTQNNGELQLGNLRDRKLTVRYIDNEPDSLYINYDCPISIQNRNIPAINGVLHQMEKVIAPKDITMADLMYEILEKEKEGFIVASRLALACGLRDTFNAIEDNKYRELYMKGLIPDYDGQAAGWTFKSGNTSPAYAPTHRRYGFTVFAETDDFWRRELGKEPIDITCQDVQQWVYDNKQFSRDDVFTTDNNWASPYNLLNQWFTYHVLPMRIAANRLVFHVNEYGYNQTLKQLTIPVYEFYATMGKRRLLKIFESKESEGIFLNRFPTLDNGRRGTYHEISCDADKVGCHIDNYSENVLTYQALNGIIYAIDKPLSYTDEVRENLAKSRIRFDAMSLFPEAMTNDLRKKVSVDPHDQFVHFPPNKTYRYLDNMDMNNETQFVYLNAYQYNWCNNQEDELKAVGHYEITIKLPPVPRRGTYELRYRVLPNGDRGIVQFYFGYDKERLAPTGIPIDLRKSGTDPNFGYEPDTEDDFHNIEVDKHMRNNNRMRGEMSIQNSNGPCRTGSPSNLRHILVRQTIDPDKTYYLRLKSVLDNQRTEMYMDYLEWCAKEIYDNPVEPEDIW